MQQDWTRLTRLRSSLQVNYQSMSGKE